MADGDKVLPELPEKGQKVETDVDIHFTSILLYPSLCYMDYVVVFSLLEV